MQLKLFSLFFWISTLCRQLGATCHFNIFNSLYVSADLLKLKEAHNLHDLKQIYIRAEATREIYTSIFPNN
eukprot:Gb_26375 [translate_table: standard]